MRDFVTRKNAKIRWLRNRLRLRDAAGILKIFTQILLVIVGAKAFPTKDSTALARRYDSAGRSSVEVDVNSPLDQLALPERAPMQGSLPVITDRHRTKRKFISQTLNENGASK